MLLRPIDGQWVIADSATASFAARALDAILPGASIRESRFPISMS